MITIRINSGAARNQLNFMLDKIEHPAEMLQESAGRVRTVLRGHFAERDRAGNKLGGRRSHFWAQFAHATEVGQVTDRTADVDIGDPKHKLAHKISGGTIRAKTPWRGSGFLLLTIPVHPAAYGKRAKELKQDGLKLVFVGSAAGGVLGTFAKNAAEDEVYYVCVPSVDQAADPQALPPGEEMEQAALEGAGDYLALEVQASQNQTNEP
jgi:hypothetical protein